MNNYNENKIKNLIGILIATPIYMIILIILNLLGFRNLESTIIPPLLMYLPIIIGMVLSYKYYKDKTSLPIGISILIFILLSSFFYYNGYVIEHSDWGGMLEVCLWLINTGICKILTYIFYGKIVGKKKAMCFVLIEILCMILPFLI